MRASPPDAPSAVALLREGAWRFDGSRILQQAAVRCARRGFTGGAAWMALALSELRGSALSPPRAGAVRLGVIKYGVSALAATIVVGIAFAAGHALLLPLAVVAFYVVEAAGAFVFPAFADGSARPWAESRRLVFAAGGLGVVASRMFVVALVMVLGGFSGRGFLRSWCIGCLTVALWYERLRR